MFIINRNNFGLFNEKVFAYLLYNCKALYTVIVGPGFI